MKRFAWLFCPVLLAAVSAGCLHRRVGNRDSHPGHTFGRDGIAAREGGVLGERDVCPACQWVGTKCAACRAAEAAEATPADVAAPARPVDARDEADHMISLLEAGRRTDRDTEQSPGAVSPYAPLRDR